MASQANDSRNRQRPSEVENGQGVEKNGNGEERRKERERVAVEKTESVRERNEGTRGLEGSDAGRAEGEEAGRRGGEDGVQLLENSSEERSLVEKEREESTADADGAMDGVEN